MKPGRPPKPKPSFHVPDPRGAFTIRADMAEYRRLVRGLTARKLRSLGHQGLKRLETLVIVALQNLDRQLPHNFKDLENCLHRGRMACVKSVKRVKTSPLVLMDRWNSSIQAARLTDALKSWDAFRWHVKAAFPRPILPAVGLGYEWQTKLREKGKGVGRPRTQAGEDATISKYADAVQSRRLTKYKALNKLMPGRFTTTKAAEHALNRELDRRKTVPKRDTKREKLHRRIVVYLKEHPQQTYRHAYLTLNP